MSSIQRRSAGDSSVITERVVLPSTAIGKDLRLVCDSEKLGNKELIPKAPIL
jgi:hypothetical protein